MKRTRGSAPNGAVPPYPPYPPAPPYPTYPPYPPFPPYPAHPCPPPAASSPCEPSAPQLESDERRDEGPREHGEDETDRREEEAGKETNGRGDDGHGDGDGGPGTTPPPGTSPETPTTPEQPIPESGIPPPRVAARRPDDLLIFDVTFGGVVFKTNPPRLERSEADAFIVVEFPPQSFGEEAYLESKGQTFTPEPDPKKENAEVTDDPKYPKKNVEGDDEQNPSTLPAARVRMSQRSRVGVTMPAGVDTIGYDLATVLSALRDWPMRLDGNAVDDPPLLNLQLETSPQIEAVVADPQLAGGTAAASAATGVGEFFEALPEPVRLLFGPREPGPTSTALELPYRLVTSPIGGARWRHAPDAVEHRGRVELWHTRLTTSKTLAGPDESSRIRALWSPDYRPKAKVGELIELLSTGTEPPEPNPDLVRMSLDPLDRSMLVTLMAGFDSTLKSGRAYRPISSEAKRLHLSALGALLDAEGTWTITPEHVDLEQWRHLSTLGRDQYVRVMYKGYLCPFGHAASLIKVTERKFESLGDQPSRRVAMLRQRFYIVVREPVRRYSGFRHTHQGRDFPFSQVEILSRVTPDLSEPGMNESALKAGGGVTQIELYKDIAQRMLFWPMVPAASSAITDFRFEIAATDIAGNRTTFSLPLLFVGKLADANRSEQLRKSYNAAAASTKRLAVLGGAVVCYAPSSPSDQGDPNLPTKTLTFRVGDLFPVGTPNLYPEVDKCEAGVKPIQKMLSQPNFIAELEYPKFYIDSGFDPTANKGQIFLKLTAPKALTFGGPGNQAKSDSLGALATPQMDLLGLSKILGPVAGDASVKPVEDALGTVKDGGFNPADFFKDATLLGGIKIGEIVTSSQNLSGAETPKMLSRDFPDRVESTFEWTTDVTEIDTLKLLIPRADDTKPPTRLQMNAVVQTPRDPAKPPIVNATAAISNFKVNLFGFIILWFEELTFTSKNGQKPDVGVRMRDGDQAVMFGGPLEFVNELRAVIPGNGFSDPPGLSVTPSGITASYSLTLPAVGVGVFALSNASLGAAFNLPFDAKPVSVRFNFSRRDAPFSLTVSLLGGGGFFAIGVSARGVNEIEAALEFGAAISIDLGVASGGVEVKAGIYFHWLEPVPDEGSVELAGYVRIHGELTVLALISVSLTFHLQLGYQKQGKKSVCYGEATLTVEIEILMFSAEVSVKCRREFAGGEADPRFIDLIPTQQIWTAYCEAFAADEAA